MQTNQCFQLTVKSVMYVFDIEEKVDQLFDEAYPPSPFGDPRLNKSGYKPLLAESLGFIVPDTNARRTIKDKEYYKVDQDDFLEFATSGLPKDSILPFFPNSRLLVFSFIDEEETGIATEYLGSEVKVSLLDAIIARHGPGVSITARIAYKDAKSNNWIGFERERWEELVTLTYFPSDKSHPSSGDALIEWDRNVVLCPLPDDDEWRFVFADGPYAEYLSNEIKGDKDSENYRYVDNLVKVSKAESEKYSVQIELARLCLCLPQYVAFMYDLVSYQPSKSRRNRLPKKHLKPQRKAVEEVLFTRS